VVYADRPYILGEAPSGAGDRYWRFPLSGAVGERLCRWSGLVPLASGSRYGKFYWPLAHSFELHNLLERWPGPQGDGSAFPLELAQPAWEALWPTLEGRVVVVLGGRLLKLSRGPEGAFWTWYRDRRSGTFLVAVPHPSGLNRIYNDRENVKRTAWCLQSALWLASSLAAAHRHAELMAKEGDRAEVRGSVVSGVRRAGGSQ
jgi:uracil-DNA glycosylase